MMIPLAGNIKKLKHIYPGHKISPSAKANGDVSQGKAIYPVLGQNPYPGKWPYPVYTWDDFLKYHVSFRQTLHGEESCGNA